MHGLLGISHSRNQQRALERYIATWDFAAERPDELSLTKVSKYNNNIINKYTMKASF